MAMQARSSPVFALVAAALLLFLPLACEASDPSWANGKPIDRRGKSLTLICEGASPLAKDLALKAALAACTRIAAAQVDGSARVKSLIVSTEQDAALNEEVSSDKEVTGLVPKILESFTEQAGEGFRAIIKISYDLSKVTVAEVEDAEPESSAGKSLVVDGEGASEQPSGIKRGSLTRSGNRTLLVTTVPKCASLIVRGKSKSRVIRCEEGAMPVTIFAEDRELIARPPKGYLPKTIKLTGDRKPSSDDYETDEIEIYFER